MKPYGLDRMACGDTDVAGCTGHGRRSSVGNLPNKSGEVRSYRSLRGGRKARTRRLFKRIARAAGRAEIEASE